MCRTAVALVRTEKSWIGSRKHDLTDWPRASNASRSSRRNPPTTSSTRQLKSPEAMRTVRRARCGLPDVSVTESQLEPQERRIRRHAHHGQRTCAFVHLGRYRRWPVEAIRGLPPAEELTKALTDPRPLLRSER